MSVLILFWFVNEISASRLVGSVAACLIVTDVWHSIIGQEG